MPVVRSGPRTSPSPPGSSAEGDADTASPPSRWSFVWGAALFVVAMSVSIAIGWVISSSRGVTLPLTSISDYDPLGRLVGALCGALIALVGFRLIVRRVEGRTWTALDGRRRLIELLLGVGIGTVIISAAIGLIALLGGYDVSGLHAAPDVLTPLASGIGAGVMEEVFYRGFALRLLDHWVGTWGALALTSVYFGFSHFTNPGVAWWGSISIAVQAGLLLGAAYLVTRRLWMSIGIHAAWNFLQSALFSYSASADGTGQGVLDATVSGSSWMTGGGSGLEGSLISTVLCLAAAIILLAIAHRIAVGTSNRAPGPVSGPAQRAPRARHRDPGPLRSSVLSAVVSCHDRQRLLRRRGRDRAGPLPAGRRPQRRACTAAVPDRPGRTGGPP